MTSAIRRLLLVTFVVAACVAASAAGADPVPVVVAVDTSRSLDASALSRMQQALGASLDRLDADVPTGLLAFDDTPRWIHEVGASPAEVSASLDDLRLQGNFTLLYDALFVVARALPEGGIVVLATDGRDENSAVLVDDIARLAEAQDVRVVAVGLGAPIQEKSLRRVALISNGRYVGPIDAVEPAALAEAIEAARTEIAADRVADAASTPRPVAPPPAAQPPIETAAPSPWWANPLAWLVGLLALGLVVAVIGLTRRRPTVEAPPEIDDAAEDEAARAEDDAADEAEAGMVRLELAQTPAATPKEAPEVTVDTAVFQQMSLDERLERTRVLSNHSVVLMRKLNEQPRTFLLDGDKAFAVGR
ncbi:MAG: vWA domain-containing protein, partial [Acidobacteriota bacterium]